VCPEYALAGVAVAEGHYGCLTAEDAEPRHGVRRGEPLGAERGAAIVGIAEVASRAVVGAHLRVPVHRAGCGLVLRGSLPNAKIRVGINEARVKRLAAHVPHAGIGRRADIGANRLDYSVAHYQSCAIEYAARGYYHAGVGECMYTGRVVAQCGYRLGPAGLLCAGFARQEGEQRDEPEKTPASHRVNSSGK